MNISSNMISMDTFSLKTRTMHNSETHNPVIDHHMRKGGREREREDAVKDMEEMISLKNPKNIALSHEVAL